jgi:hypothetical protein
MCPLLAIITGVLVLREKDFGVTGVLLAISFNMGLLWFLLLTAGIEQLSPYSWMYLAVTTLSVIIALSSITAYRR